MHTAIRPAQQSMMAIRGSTMASMYSGLNGAGDDCTALAFEQLSGAAGAVGVLDIDVIAASGAWTWPSRNTTRATTALAHLSQLCGQVG
jgi:hypothetical protein